VGGAEEYLEFASRLVAISGCIDIFIVNEDTFVGVEALSPLVDRVGGSLVFYPSIGASTLPQDLYKTFARPFATRGLLRIRCSSGFQVNPYLSLSPSLPLSLSLHICLSVQPSLFLPSSLSSALPIYLFIPPSLFHSLSLPLSPSLSLPTSPYISHPILLSLFPFTTLSIHAHYEARRYLLRNLTIRCIFLMPAGCACIRASSQRRDVREPLSSLVLPLGLEFRL